MLCLILDTLFLSVKNKTHESIEVSVTPQVYSAKSASVHMLLYLHVQMFTLQASEADTALLNELLMIWKKTQLLKEAKRLHALQVAKIQVLE